MKRTFITLIIALMAMAGLQAAHRPHIRVERDSAGGADKEVNISDSALVVKKGGKTVTISYGNLKNFIEDHLDDTILTGTDDAAVVVDDDDAEADEATTSSKYEYMAEQARADRDMAVEGMELSRDISAYFATAAVFIVFFALLFYYLHRARKYKTVDRAIAAGYPLPDEFYLGRKTVQQNVYTQPGPDGVPPLPPMASATSGRLLDNITDWNLFKPGLTLTAVGLGMSLFFLVAGAKPLAALMLILLIIGLGRLFVAYQEQLNINRFRAANPQQQRQAPAAPQQQPPMPPQDTPPAFSNPDSTTQQ